jgi:5'-3' exonuclease
MDKVLSIIDFDGMLYHSTRDTLEESIEALKDKLQNCLDKTGCTHWTGFVGKGKTFRHSISPDYKANRTGKPPKYLSALKEWSIAEYNLNVCIGYEADDAVGYFYSISEFTRLVGHSEIEYVPDEILNKDTVKILCSPDKDILKGFAGKHFNYTYRITDEAKEIRKINPDYIYTEEDTIKGNWVETSKINAYKFRWIQTLMGDSADGICGIPKIGIVGATKIIDLADSRFSSIVLDKYIDYYQNESEGFSATEGIYEFQKNYRLLHILENDKDFLREVGKVPDYPNITEIVRDLRIEDIEIKDSF